MAESLLNDSRTRLEAVECTSAVLPILLQHVGMLLREVEGTSEHRHNMTAVRGAVVRPAPGHAQQFRKGIGATSADCWAPDEELGAAGDLLTQAAELLLTAQAYAQARLKAVLPSGCPNDICPPAKRDLASVEASLARLAMCELRAPNNAGLLCNTAATDAGHPSVRYRHGGAHAHAHMQTLSCAMRPLTHHRPFCSLTFALFVSDTSREIILYCRG